MKTKQLLVLPVLAFVTSIGLNQAAADMAPPEGYVEDCTLQKQQVDGKACVSCSSYYATVDKCKNEYSGQGYSKACQSWGASVWTEIWCKGGSAGAAGAPNTASAGAANAGSAGATSAGNGGFGPGVGGAINPVTGGASAVMGGSSNSAVGGASSATGGSTYVATGGSTYKASSSSPLPAKGGSLAKGGASPGKGGASPKATTSAASGTPTAQTVDDSPSRDDDGCTIAHAPQGRGLYALLAGSALAAMAMRRRRQNAK